MEDIAIQLFKVGDQEQKGFIVKRDMQRFQSEVSLPADQLEAVFDSLDTTNKGFLTLDQFLAGVNNLNGETELGNEAGQSEADLSIEKLLNLNVLHKSGELVCEMRGLVGGDDLWHQLLAALFSDLNQLLRQISLLEDTLRARDHQHSEELRRLYEELENQLSDERDRLQKQLCQREALLRAELGTKDQQIAELLGQKDHLQERLRLQAEALPQPTNSHHQCCQRRKEDIPDEDSWESTLKSELQAKRSYEEGFRHAHHMAMLHEEGLVKQLQLLQEMQETLKSNPKNRSQRRESNYEDI